MVPRGLQVSVNCNAFLEVHTQVSHRFSEVKREVELSCVALQHHLEIKGKMQAITTWGFWTRVRSPSCKVLSELQHPTPAVPLWQATWPPPHLTMEPNHHLTREVRGPRVTVGLGVAEGRAGEVGGRKTHHSPSKWNFDSCTTEVAKGSQWEEYVNISGVAGECKMNSESSDRYQQIANMTKTATDMVILSYLESHTSLLSRVCHLISCCVWTLPVACSLCRAGAGGGLTTPNVNRISRPRRAMCTCACKNFHASELAKSSQWSSEWPGEWPVRRSRVEKAEGGEGGIVCLGQSSNPAVQGFPGHKDPTWVPSLSYTKGVCVCLVLEHWLYTAIVCPTHSCILCSKNL